MTQASKIEGGARFVDALGRALGIEPSQLSTAALAKALNQVLPKSRSARQINRWANNESRPSHADVSELIEGLNERGIAEPLVQQVRRAYRDWTTATAREPNIELSQYDAATFIRDAWNAQHHQAMLHAELNMRGMLLRVHSDGKRIVEKCVDPASEVDKLLTQEGSERISICLIGHERGDLDHLCRCIYWKLMSDYLPGNSVPPLPLYVEWDAWVRRMELVQPSPLTSAAADLVSSAHVPGVAGEDALAALEAPGVVVITTGIELNISAKKLERACHVLRRTLRVLVASSTTDDLLNKWPPGDFTHAIYLLPSPGVLAVADRCRQSLSNSRPGGPNLGSLGSNVECLKYRAIAGRILAMIERGDLTVETMGSESAVLGAWYLDNLIESDAVTTNGDQSWSPEQYSEIPRLRNIEIADMIVPNNDSFIERDSEWQRSAADIGRAYIKAYLPRHMHEINDKHVLNKIDAQGAYLLARKRRWNPSEYWREIIDTTLDELTAEKTPYDTWSSVSHTWSLFVTALGALRAKCETGDQEMLELKQRTHSILQAQWAVDDGALGRGSLRYYGARALSALLTWEDANRALNSLDDVDDASKAARIACLAEVGLGVCTRILPPAETLGATELAATFLDILQKYPVTSGTETNRLRHARYHVAVTISRLGHKLQTREGFEKLLGGLPIDENRMPEAIEDRAIESATALGVLWKMPARITAAPGSVANFVAEQAIIEIEKYWGRHAPLFIEAHVYLAFQSLAPMLPRFHRRTLIARLDDYISQRPHPVEQWVADTGSLRYLIYYLRNEIVNGISLPSRLRTMLSAVAAALKARANDAPRHENQIREDLDVLLMATEF